MTIHHAILKKAADKAVEMTETEEGVRATWTVQPELFAYGKTAKATLDLALRFRGVAIEYPTLLILQEPDDEDAFVATQNGQVLAEGEDLDEVIAEALEAYEQQPETEDEEPAHSGSIVKSRYREEYKARGNAANCGDWLAEQFTYYAKTRATIEVKLGGKMVKKSKDVPDLEAYYAIALANGIEKQWRHLNRGQQAMNVSNMVRANLIKAGKLEIPASLTGGHHLSLEPPANWNAEREARAAAKKNATAA